ncbi:MAG TPA: carotenoid oxygenase family protein [Rhabdochlamydiaceae bacterium]
MLNKTCIWLCLVLCACSSQPSHSKGQQFLYKNLLFDLDAEVSHQPCRVQGQIPAWLSGTLLRNGPAKFTADGKRVGSWFDGLAMLNAFEFTPQEVFYTNRFIRSNHYEIMVKQGTLNFSGFAQDPCAAKFKDQKTVYVPKAAENVVNANVNITKYADKMVALTEIPLPVAFDPKTLDTLGVFDYQDKLPHSKTWESAHPHHDAGENINYFVQFGEKSTYVIWKMKDGASSREALAEIPVDLPSYMHSFAVTENYVVLVEFPFVVDPTHLQPGKAFISNYQWKPERGTLFLVVVRKTGQVVSRIKTEPFFAFHHANAYDKEGTIYIDIITYPNADVMGIIAKTEEGGNNKNLLTQLQRFTITTKTQKIAQETIFDQTVEMPTVPDAMASKDYRYCYTSSNQFPTSEKEMRPLYKIDVKNKMSKSWVEEGCFAGEPIFVPRPGAESEDDGVVLSLVLDFDHHRSFLLILDGQNFTELARAEAPHAIPVGLHGIWKGQ